MAMTFTGAIHAAQAGEEELRTVLTGAVGCNIAWGVIDAVMYVMSTLVSRGHLRRSLQALKRATTHEQVRAILDDELPEGVIRAMRPVDYDGLRRWIESLPEHHRRLGITARTWKGALGVFLLVTLSTFPVVIPLLLLDEPVLAVRLSHGVALVMLFLIGRALGRHAGMNPWLTGLSMLLLGVVLAAMTIVLGG